MAAASAVLLSCLLALGNAAIHPVPFSAAQLDAEGPSPIQKVVALIKDMKAQTEKEAAEDLEAYDKYMCWCETVKKEKTAAVKNAQDTIASLEAFVEEAAAKEGELKTEIAGLTDDIAADEESLSSAEALREKEAAEFAVEEADMKETVSLLAEAIEVLSKVQLLQKQGKATGSQKQAALLQVRKLVQRFPKFQGVMQKDLYDLLGSTQTFLPKITSLQQSGETDGALPWEKSEEQIGKEANPNDEVGAAAGAKSYNSRSGGIVGLLKEMGSKTSKDLAAAQKAEMEALASFNSLKAAKTAEIAAATEQKEMKEAALADLLDKVAKSKEDMETTKSALSADEQLLLEASKSCTTEEEEYAGRAKVRSEEIKALGETLDILTGDEARDLFSKTISFVQLVSHQDQARDAARNAAATSAMQRIMKVARSHKNWALASLAVHLKLDAFTKVKEAMDKMTKELKAQMKAEVEKKEFCTKKIDETEDTLKVEGQTKADLDAKNKGLTSTIEGLKAEIATLSEEVTEAQISLKKAGEDRKAANELYQQSMSDQRATIAILNMALKRLKEFYTPKLLQVAIKAHSHQEPGAAVAPPPPKPSGYEKSASSGGVLQLLAMVISDAEATESELKLTEQQEQEEYAAFVSATTTAIEADRSSVTEKEKQVASASSELSYTEESQLSNAAEITKLEELLQATHGDCDYIIKYFDMRQTARKEELDAIAEAKAILSGADFS